MNEDAQDRSKEDLAEMARYLRAERPELTALELDELKQRVRRRTRPVAPFLTRKKARIMKSRLALMSMLTVGLLMSLSGVGLAVSAISDDNSAAVSQYGTTTTPPISTPDVTTTPTDAGTLGEEESEAGTEPTTEEEGVTAGANEQRQVASSDDDDLPFTGFAAIPLLLGGIALLTTGAVLRKRSDDSV
jgi:hypothetical protein